MEVWSNNRSMSLQKSAQVTPLGCLTDRYHNSIDLKPLRTFGLMEIKLMPMEREIDPEFERRRADVMSNLQVLLEGNVDPLTVVLNSHLFVEQCLTEAVRRRLPHPELLGDRLKFLDYLEFAGALGAVPSEHMSAYKALNALRNRIAHRFGYDPTSQDIASLKGAFDSHLLELLSRHERFRGETRLSDAVLCIITVAESMLVSERFLSAAEEITDQIEHCHKDGLFHD